MDKIPPNATVTTQTVVAVGDTDQLGLPPPVQQAPSISSRKTMKKTRIDSGIKKNLRVHWDRLLRKMGNGTAPSSSSAFDESTAGESSGYQRPTRVEDVDEPVDEVVVDREWAEELKSTSATHSDHGGTPERGTGSNAMGGTSTDRDSLAMHTDGFWGLWTPLIWLRWRLWPLVLGFFLTEFLDKKSEEHYNKENWFLRKSLAIWSACFYILNWTLAVIVTPRPTVLPDTIFYYVLTPVFTFPLVLMVILDFPRDRPVIYQVFLGLSTWGWGIYQDKPGLYSCQGKDFLSTFYYTTALQTIALFGLKMHRFSGLVGMITFAVVGGILVIPDRRQFTRYIVNFIVFQLFLLYVHYMRENAERRLYTLRDQLKIQFRATQKAQVNERKAADSKRRLTSYVFHEVRVPLNTALLAVQNMDASGTVAKAQEIEFKALEGSLSMMSKVLNDVLDFNRMDSGRFESVLRPYAFHKVMRSLFVPLQLATDARGLTFVTDLDKSIDDVARRALYEALDGLTEQEIDKRMALDEDGIVVGDETRLRQIITNLASNACKFTPHGGSLTIKTRLVLPIRPVRSVSSSVKGANKLPMTPGTIDTTTSFTDTPKSEYDEQQLSAARLDQHNSIHNKAPPIECIVVRIEVTDTGCGIRRKDMVQSKLFSAFNQTEMGRQQGGKGTGLGLALVRQIVKLSGGRLGVQSKVNEGSTFWVEIPLGVGAKAVPGLVAVQTPDGSQDTSDMSFSELMNSPFAPSKDDTPPAQVLNVGTRTSSALHSIMEQGGLVELSAKRGDNSLVLTRTIGDPLTGTDAFPQSVNEEASPTSANQELPNSTLQNYDGVRPNFLKLPAPRDFSLQRINSSVDESPHSTVIVHTPGNPSPPTSPGHEPGLKVLVVDDDPLTRKLMSRMLTRIGCRVSTAENGEMALEMILGMTTQTRVTPSSEEAGYGGGFSNDGAGTVSSARISTGSEEYKYAIVFLDNQMPVMSGLEAVAKLRELKRHDFVIGVTGNALLSDQHEYLEAGVDHVLTKPVYEKSLRAMLAIAEERRKQGTPRSEAPADMTHVSAS
ncbi:hypothetical protein BDY19DRAFT_904154 [Irpex rosettiformis]|uniref:Uncharacterized protein n=1 Tax=Irpex rosettiformis TaxID=378272 RepID=A0ACB8UB78_9APHY|nr:hypothetical protein BDY19DRAFT_904154 [Irpex rosettiformis]